MSAGRKSGRLAEKIVIVTGAGSGLGRAAALLFAHEGASVICGDLQEAAAEETASAIRSEAGDGRAAALDVTDERSAEGIVAGTLKAHGRIDGLYNCAGIGFDGTVLMTSLKDWNRVIAVNLTGTFLMNRAVLGPMRDRRAGSIVNVASVGGIAGVPSNAAYAASKAGVSGLVRQITVDFAAEGIRANAICPGTVPTPLVLGRRFGSDRRKIAEWTKRASRRYPMGRLGTVEEIANLALYLISDESCFINGQSIAIDGGVSSTAWKITE